MPQRGRDIGLWQLYHLSSHALDVRFPYSFLNPALLTIHRYAHAIAPPDESAFIRSHACFNQGATELTATSSAALPTTEPEEQHEKPVQDAAAPEHRITKTGSTTEGGRDPLDFRDHRVGEY